MTARHAIWLHRVPPCDVEAFLRGAHALLDGQSADDQLRGDDLFNLTCIAVIKWPLAIQTFVQEVRARTPPLDAQEYLAVVDRVCESVDGVDLQWMHAQISSNRMNIVAGLPHVMKALGIIETKLQPDVSAGRYN